MKRDNAFIPSFLKCADKNNQIKSQCKKSPNERTLKNDKKDVQIITSSGVLIPMEGIWAHIGFTASVYFDQ